MCELISRESVQGEMGPGLGGQETVVGALAHSALKER